MITVKLNDVDYKLPKELTIQAWQNIVAWDFEVIQNRARIVSAATGAPYDLLKQLDPDDLELPTIFIVNLLNQRRPHKHVDFNELTFGQFVDLDVYLSLGVDKHLGDMVEILSGHKLLASEACYIVDQYNQWRTHIYRAYKTLFGLDEEDFDNAEESEDPKDKMHIARSWYKTIVGLANDDLLKIDEVTEQPLKKVLNFMALRKEQQLEANARELKKKQQYDLQRNRR